MEKDKKFESRGSFVEYLKSLGGRDAQIDALMQYFVDNVEYDYLQLEITKARFGKNVFDFMNFQRKYDVNDEHQREIALEELKKFGYSNKLYERIKQTYGKLRLDKNGEIVKDENGNVVLNNLIWGLNDTESVTENGMLKKGVCNEFADFIVKICKEVGIPAQRREGTTTVGHGWVAMEGADGVMKNYDPTYAIYIRDYNRTKDEKYKYKGWEENTEIKDWFGLTDEEMLKLQPFRKITSKKILSDSGGYQRVEESTPAREI